MKYIQILRKVLPVNSEVLVYLKNIEIPEDWKESWDVGLECCIMWA